MIRENGESWTENKKEGMEKIKLDVLRSPLLFN
jgi:hypothetical protein